MSASILQVAGLSKSFDGTVALDDLSLTVEEGEIHGIIGPNGSGKTTLFDVVTGFQGPDDGRVYFDGVDVTGRSPDARAREGLLRTFQETRPFTELTVEENLLVPFSGGLGSGLRITSAERDRAATVLETLDLTGVADEAAGDLSGGQQKLLELGRVLMLEPDCLLLDEPTASVNPALQEHLLETLRTVNDDGTTLVVIEHDMSVLESLSDRVSVLNRGRLVTQGSVEDVTADARVRQAYLGPSPGSPPETEAGEQRRTGTEQSEQESVETGETESADGTGSRTTAPRTGGSGTTAVQSVSPRESAPGTASMSHSDLVADEIVTGYGNHRVVDGVSIRSHDGVTCIFGPNGSGKSTLLKALAGVHPVWSGEISYRGRAMIGRDAYEYIEAGIVMVPQRDMIFQGLSVRENLLLGATSVEDDTVVEERIEAVLDSFPALEGRLSKRAGSLSGGQQTMVGFARAQMSGADLLLLDEPTSSLAPDVAADVFDMVETIVDSGTQVILVEQNVSAALPITDHVYILSQGQLQFDGSPDALASEEQLLARYLGID